MREGDERYRSELCIRFPRTTLRLPGWVHGFSPTPKIAYPTVEGRMELAIGLARENVGRGMGMPFGAAILGLKTNKPVVPGVNLAVASGLSVAHAEVGRRDLDRPGRARMLRPRQRRDAAAPRTRHQHRAVRHALGGDALVRHTQPRLRHAPSARAVGFDEGPEAPRWESEFEERGIAVVRDVFREEGTDVLKCYAGEGGEVYRPPGWDTLVPQNVPLNHRSSDP